MPLYDYECPNGHTTTKLTTFTEGDRRFKCSCGRMMKRVMSVPAKRTDGIYSYDENVGDPQKFERWREGE